VVFGFVYLPFLVFVFAEKSGVYHTKRSTLVKVGNVITSLIQSALSHSIYMINFNIALIFASRSQVILCFREQARAREKNQFLVLYATKMILLVAFNHPLYNHPSKLFNPYVRKQSN
jgi:hypothetical protein